MANTVMERAFGSTVLADPKDVRWGSPAWPEKVEGFRSHQIDAVEEAMEMFGRGVEVVLLDAPTGSGKTVIAEMIRRQLRAKRAAYIANTNSLLDQFQRDFPYAMPLKGRVNYPTLDHPESFSREKYGLTAADCSRSMVHLPACGSCPTTDEMRGGLDDDDDEGGEDPVDDRLKPHCDHCHPLTDCPYMTARGRALGAALCVTNTSYFISDIGTGINSGFSAMGMRGECDLVVVDECDTLESILMGHVELNISKRTAGDYDINPPKVKTAEAKSNDWVEWLEVEAKVKVGKALKGLKGRMGSGGGGKTSQLREKKKLERLAGKLKILGEELERENVVYDGYKSGDIIFRPVKIDHAAPKLFWEHGRRFLCMSATLFADEFVESTGLENTTLEYGVVKVPSTFPKERRPIYYKGVANNTYKNRDHAWPAILGGVKSVLDIRPDARVLVHTVSYGFSNYLRDGLLDAWDYEREIITHKGADGRQAALDQLRSTPRGVLLSASMERGVDLPGAQCDVAIIPKVPFMSTQDKQVMARMYSKGGSLWYSTQTLKSLVQMSGRHMRSADDFAETWILDEQFLTNVWRNNRRMLPEWWSESVDWGGGGI